MNDKRLNCMIMLKTIKTIACVVWFNNNKEKTEKIFKSITTL